MAIECEIALYRFLLRLLAIHLLLLLPLFSAERCPSENNWMQVGMSCYHVVEDSVTWYRADDLCKDFGGVLVVLNSQAEQDAVWEMVTREGLQSGDFWIGCRKGEGSAGEWSCIGHDDVPYEGWDPNEKNYGEGDPATTRYCARMRGQVNGLWADIPCNKSYNAICETPPEHDIYCTTLADEGRIVSQCLAGHVIKELPIKGVIACGSACREEPRCRSFNVRGVGQGIDETCLLNNQTATEVGAASSMTPEENCYYFDL